MSAFVATAVIGVVAAYLARPTNHVDPNAPAVVVEVSGMHCPIQCGLPNVTAEVRDFVATGCGRADESVGYAMLFNILHIEDPVGLLREVNRVLVPGGLAGIVHCRSDIPTPRGPSPDQCRRWGVSAGLEFLRSESLCCCSWHWGVVMRRPRVPSRP